MTSFSDNITSVETLKSWIKTFAEERNWDEFHNPKDLAIGLVTESSELLEIFRFIKESDLEKLLKDPHKREAIADELADSLCFILRFAQRFEFDLTTCMKNKLGKNAVKYPKTHL